MINLRHIICDDDKSISLPKGFGECTSLRTLPKFVVSKGSGAGIEELKALNQLWGDIRIEGLDNIRNVGYAHEANLKAKQHLYSLELSWSDVGTVAPINGNAEEVIENLEPHSNLKVLVVKNYMGLTFPTWVMMLTNLVDIELFHCNVCERLPPLGRLRFLKSLKIGKMSAVKYIVEVDGSHNYKDMFPSLKLLGLSGMPNLEGWSSQQKDGVDHERGKQVIFQGLRTLRINNVPKLKRLPWLHLPPSLESLILRRVGCDMIEIPTSQSLIALQIFRMPNLERWSRQEADDDEDDYVIFPSLRSLSFIDCPKLICLPLLLLPDLKYLHMEKVGCDHIEFSISQSLRKAKFTNMPNLERWSSHEVKGNDEGQVIFSHLKLEVKECPRMVCLPHLLPSLQTLSISVSSEMLLGSVATYPSLAKLSIAGFPEVKYFPKEFGPNHTSLHTLEISDCPKLMSLSYQLENLLALKELKVEGCSDLVLSLPNGLQQRQRQQSCPPLNSLEGLYVTNSCENQTSLLGDGIFLPSLRNLTIRSCGNLEALSVDMLQNLTFLEIIDSPHMWSSLITLENLNSLKNLRISGCPGTDMMNFLESVKNLTSLTDLVIKDCPGMTSLPESMKNLTSLTDLRIINCPGMRSLPESVGDLTLLRHLFIENCPDMMTVPEGLQRLRNINDLCIYKCPILERRLRYYKGEDWHKVAHIPCIIFEGEDSSDEHPSLLSQLLKKIGCSN